MIDGTDWHHCWALTGGTDWHNPWALTGGRLAALLGGTGGWHWCVTLQSGTGGCTAGHRWAENLRVALLGTDHQGTDHQ
ncbi:unnamed protein product [Staurois parvus]|uniref:Uncharacterized protein n=1 Tax=Staurois parvus TaxID=386267 RepID=A0ABN9H7L0_9NEOB|nr:unnamed protein product [Staurois parvus]